MASYLHACAQKAWSRTFDSPESRQSKASHPTSDGKFHTHTCVDSHMRSSGLSQNVDSCLPMGPNNHNQHKQPWQFLCFNIYWFDMHIMSIRIKIKTYKGRWNLWQTCRNTLECKINVLTNLLTTILLAFDLELLLGCTVTCAQHELETLHLNTFMVTGLWQLQVLLHLQHIGKMDRSITIKWFVLSICSTHAKNIKVTITVKHLTLKSLLQVWWFSHAVSAHAHSKVQLEPSKERLRLRPSSLPGSGSCHSRA